MKTPTKCVKPLTPAPREPLQAIMTSPVSQRTRLRAQAGRLSERRYALDQIADRDQGDRDRVSQGLEWWEAEPRDGLDEDPRSGRPPKLTEAERQEALKIPLPAPRSLTTGLKRSADAGGKLLRGESLRTVLSLEGYGKRRRRRSRAGRDEVECRGAAAALAQRRAHSRAGTRALDLWSYDEAGFPLPPAIPSAWQRGGQRLARAAPQGPRPNGLGFFTLPHPFPSFACHGPLDSPTVLPCFALCHRQPQTPAWVILDNAPSHTREDCEAELQRWQKEARYGKILPPSGPALTRIAILWRTSKDEGLPLDAYRNFTTLTACLFAVLKGIGAKYRLTFA
jgi:hypothetical protein